MSSRRVPGAEYAKTLALRSDEFGVIESVSDGTLFCDIAVQVHPLRLCLGGKLNGVNFHQGLTLAGNFATKRSRT